MTYCYYVCTELLRFHMFLWTWSSGVENVKVYMPAIKRNFLLANISLISIKASLTHWGRVTHICVSKLTIIGSDNGLSPVRRQAIIWTNAGILLIRTLGTNFNEIPGEINWFSFSKMHLKMSSAKWRLFGLGLNELRYTLQRSLLPGSSQGYLMTHISFIYFACAIDLSLIYLSENMYQYIILDLYHKWLRCG